MSMRGYKFDIFGDNVSEFCGRMDKMLRDYDKVVAAMNDESGDEDETVIDFVTVCLPVSGTFEVHLPIFPATIKHNGRKVGAPDLEMGIFVEGNTICGPAAISWCDIHILAVICHMAQLEGQKLVGSAVFDQLEQFEKVDGEIVAKDAAHVGLVDIVDGQVVVTRLYATESAFGPPAHDFNLVEPKIEDAGEEEKALLLGKRKKTATEQGVSINKKAKVTYTGQVWDGSMFVTKINKI